LTTYFIWVRKFKEISEEGTLTILINFIQMVQQTLEKT